MIEIRTARSHDTMDIKMLWKDLFDDTDDYIDFYVEKKLIYENVRLLIKDKKAIGMIHLLPVVLVPNQSAFYWYAAGIHHSERGKGYFRYFVEAVKKETNQLGYANLCQPASGLYHFYKKMGFNHEYFVNQLEYFGNRQPDLNISIQSAKSNDFEHLNLTSGSTKWSADAIQYAMDENIFCAGEQISFQYQNKMYFGFAIRKEDRVIIENTNINQNVMEDIQNDIISHFRVNSVILRSNLEQDDNLCLFGLSDSELVTKKSKLYFTLA